MVFLGERSGQSRYMPVNVCKLVYIDYFNKYLNTIDTAKNTLYTYKQ